MGVVFQDERKIKQGEVVAKLRRMQGIKQDALGKMCPSNFSQQKISDLESQIVIEEPTLEELATALGVTVEFIKNFNDDNAIYNIQHNHDFKDHAVAHQNHQPIFNESSKLTVLLEKLVQDDEVKTKAILDLTKVVADLAEEVKRLKGGN
ncbi:MULTISPECIES: helix-turn-helix domain-containing protein [Sphingobacterium]|uniref:helix-turn-helix domain-containing protein n=1 Tax=Sphingobacterium TaxID=28453 RepID=UPI000B48BA2A|nr:MULTISPECIES: helix-turn-helix transcriptional regulator [Sphingobacterium]